MGRRPDLTPEEAEDVRRAFYDRSAKWTAIALAHCYRVNPTTIYAILNHRGAYKRKPPSKPGETK